MFLQQTDHPTDCLTYTLTSWLTDWLGKWLTDQPTDWMTYTLTDWLTDCLDKWLTDQPTHWMTYTLADWLTDRANGWLPHRLINERNLEDWFHRGNLRLTAIVSGRSSNPQSRFMPCNWNEVQTWWATWLLKLNLKANNFRRFGVSWINCSCFLLLTRGKRMI